MKDFYVISLNHFGNEIIGLKKRIGALINLQNNTGIMKISCIKNIEWIGL